MASYLEIFYGIVVVLVALYYYFTCTFSYWKDRGIKGPEPVPLFGNIYKLMTLKQTFPQFLMSLHSKYKNEPVFGIFAIRQPILFIQDPDIIKEILIKEFSKFPNRGLPRFEVTEPLSQHLFLLEAERWRPLRTHLSPVFTSGKLRGTFSLILDCAKHLEKYMDTLVQKREPIEIREIAAQFTTDVIGSCAFGIEMNSMTEKESEFRKIGKDIFAVNFTTLLKLRIKEMFPFLYNLIGYITTDNITKFMTNLTVDTIEYRTKNNIVRPDFMNVLLQLRSHPEKLSEIKLTDSLLAAQAFVFFLAGFETSSTTIANAVYELVLNQEIQGKLREEIKKFEAENNGEWKYETIKQMTYLDKVFRETLRKYPPLSALGRESVESHTFESLKLRIPKGTKVWVPVFSIHRNPDIYPNPDKFDPERFSEEAMSARHPMHYLPFGDGPRNCIGARFAVFQTKIGLISIIRNFQCDPCEKTEVPYEFNPVGVLLRPKNGLYLKITKLENEYKM